MEDKRLGANFSLLHAHLYGKGTQTTMKDRMKFWSVLKDDYEEKEVITITTPDGAKTFAREYKSTPESGVATVTYTCNDDEYIMLLALTNHSLDIGIDALHGENADKNEFAEALKYSLNKVLAKHSLKISLVESKSEKKELIMLTNYGLGDKDMFV